MKNRLLEKTGIHDLENFDWIAYFENNIERDTAVGNFNRAHVAAVNIKQLGKLHLSIAPVLAVIGYILPQFAVLFRIRLVHSILQSLI